MTSTEALTSLADENPVVNFFPSEDAPALQIPPSEVTDPEIVANTMKLLPRIIEHLNDDEAKDAEQTSENGIYKAFRSVEDLAPTARDLYKTAGEHRHFLRLDGQ